MLKQGKDPESASKINCIGTYIRVIIIGKDVVKLLLFIDQINVS